MNNHTTPKGSLDTDDDAPDLTLSPWREMLKATPVRVGRPASEKPKVSTTIRLDQDVIEAFRRDGPGWQSRINAALKEWLGSKG
ncbi:BrnA antitoxin family protein [Peteryoungia ipomoeae]|nr:BrnA antitoxin family protein [Peteryoungia ipomoeae]